MKNRRPSHKYALDMFIRLAPQKRGRCDVVVVVTTARSTPMDAGPRKRRCPLAPVLKTAMAVVIAAPTIAAALLALAHLIMG